MALASGPLCDHLGSTAVTANASGARVTELRYYAYGGTRYDTGGQLTGYRYTGQRIEAGTGLYDYGARWYDPAIGRFLAPDTIVPQPGNPQSLNRYAYALNNSIRYTDPSGHCPWCIPIALGVLKLVDYGWTAYDTWQAGRTLANPKAADEDKLIASLTVALAGLEVLEPDDFLPASLPLDDVARRAVTGGAKEAFQQGGLRGGVQFLRGALGELAPEVIRHMYDQGMFRDIRSYREWNDILQGVRQGAGLEVHHLIEQRFAKGLGLDPSSIPSIVLTKEQHDVFTICGVPRLDTLPITHLLLQQTRQENKSGQRLKIFMHSTLTCWKRSGECCLANRSTCDEDLA